MDSLPINALDLIVLIVLLISAVLAFMRGFTHEVLSIAAWVGAVFASMYGLAPLRPIARDLIPIQWAADIAAGALIFVVALFVLHLIVKGVSKAIQDSGMGPVDRSLGVVFGLARGAILVCLAYIGLTWLVDPEDKPSWARDAKSMPAIETGAVWLTALAPDQLKSAEQKAREARASAETAMEAKQAYDKLTQPAPKSDDAKEPDGGYTQDQRQDMDRLIQNNQ